MLQDIIAVKPLQNTKLHLRFEENQEGIVDIQQQIQFTGIFEPLKDPEYFAKVKVNPELGTIQWPNGADLDPDVLYELITHSNIDFSTENTTPP
ncbi:MAG: hypothetical protein RLZZ490_634 [Cyanobacteriota bacterium]